ncbi:MAG: hypothetical protein GY953_32385 [bacterium]|nr:hypothetical protein [bacterium]
MKKFAGFVSILALVMLFAAAAPAAELEGHLVDTMCSAKVAKGGQKAAAMHTKDCAQMPPCEASGYGVVTSDSKFIKFDDAGNEKAVAALKATDKKDNLKVHVTGDVSGDNVKVTDLKLL